MTILRSHLYLPIVDAAGNLINDIDVRFYEPGTTTQIAGPLYAFASGSSELNPPVHYSNGIVDAYLATPQRVRLGITPTGQSEFFLEDVDFRHAGDNVVLVDQVLRLLGVVQPGQVVMGNSDGTAGWHVAPGAPGFLTASDITNVPAGNIASTDVQSALDELDTEKSPTAHTHSSVETVIAANSGTAYTVTTYDPHLITMTGNCVFTMPAAVAGASFTVCVVRAATAYTETWSGVRWSGGIAPVPTTGSGEEDVYTFACFDGATWLGFVAGQAF